MSAPRKRVSMAVALIFGLTLSPGLTVPLVARDKPATVRGFLYQADEVSRLAGGTVVFVNVKTGLQHVSRITEETGAYEIINLPPGTYDVAVELGRGIFVTDKLVQLGAGQSLVVSFSVQPQIKAGRSISGRMNSQGTARALVSFKGSTLQSPEIQSFWTSTQGMVLLSILSGGVGASIFYLLDDDPDVSPSSP